MVNPLDGPLVGTVALVTGASSGIGEQTAVTLAGLGADVAVAARRVDRLDALVKRIDDAAGRAPAPRW
jgi:NADP-dependent 3-hydroxy acid dehydrogenase YdfG